MSRVLKLVALLGFPAIALVIVLLVLLPASKQIPEPLTSQRPSETPVIESGISPQATMDAATHEISRCLPSANPVRLKSFEDLRDMIRKAGFSIDTASKIPRISNVHIRLANGEIRRIHYTYEDKHVQKKVFSLDKEGLPILIETTTEDPKGTVIYTDEKFTLQLSDETTIDVTTENHAVKEFRMSSPSFLLGCSTTKNALSCDCNR